MNNYSFRCGFVAIVGRPNVGKSTLINNILGSKVSIVTPKPQTTRHRILGVDSNENYQAIYIDTPGIHRMTRKAINRVMNRTAINALADADVVFFMTDANCWTREDADVLEQLQNVEVPIIAILNKIDKIHPRNILFEALGNMGERYDFSEVIPISARRRDDVSRLCKLVPDYLPVSEALFPDDMITDQSEYFRCSEIIREKLMDELIQELPYGLTVQIERFEKGKDGALINAVIWVEKNSQKGIVVGKGGRLLKKVGRAARIEINRELSQPTHLELWVKVKDNWADSNQDLLRFGYGAS